MTERHHRPVRVPSQAFEALIGADDPAAVSRVAHDTARALLQRARGEGDQAVVARLVAYADEHGIDEIAELWAGAASRSLPGALWRLYLLRQAVRANPAETSYVFRRGYDVDRSISSVVAGAATPTGPEEVVALADVILHGAFSGDFALALERAAAFCLVMSQGATSLAKDEESVAPARARQSTRRAIRYLEMGEDLHASAGMWRLDTLD